MDYRRGEEAQDHRLEPSGWHRRKATGYRGPLPSSDLETVLGELEGTLQRLGRYVGNEGEGQ